MNPKEAGRSLKAAASRGPVVSVLLVDEDASDLEAFSMRPEKDGYAVRARNNHADALQRLASEAFDFIIVSQGSPAFEGRSILRRANEIDRELPVLVLARCHDIGRRHPAGLFAGAVSSSFARTSSSLVRHA
jgi:DNA-binding response OmpR family regulator